MTTNLDHISGLQTTFVKQHLIKLATSSDDNFLDSEPDMYNILLYNLLSLKFIYPIGYIDESRVTGKRELTNAIDVSLPKIILRESKTVFAMNPYIAGYANHHKKNVYPMFILSAGRIIFIDSIVIRGLHSMVAGIYIQSDLQREFNGRIFKVSDESTIRKLFYALREMRDYNLSSGAIYRAEMKIIKSNEAIIQSAKEYEINYSKYKTNYDIWVMGRPKLLTIQDINYLRDIGISVNPNIVSLGSLYDYLDRINMLLPFLNKEESAVINYKSSLVIRNQNQVVQIKRAEIMLQYGLYTRICDTFGYKYDKNSKNLNELIISINKLGGKKSLLSVEYQYELEMSEINAVVNNICDHIPALKLLRKNRKIWEKFRGQYLGPRDTIFYMCKKCNLNLMCPHSVDFYNDEPLEEYYERVGDKSNVVVCKICQLILIDGTAGDSVEIVTGTNKELRDLIWKNLQNIKSYVNFTNILDMKGDSPYLDKRIIDQVYNILYEVNITLCRIKSLSLSAITDRQVFYNHIYIMLAFLMAEYPMCLDVTSVARNPKYKTRSNITIDEAIKFIMNLDADIIKSMNYGEVQVKAIFSSAASKMNKLLFGDIVTFVNPMLNIINMNTILSLALGRVIGNITPIISSWSSSETKRAFNMELQELNTESFMREALLLNKSKEDFEKYVMKYPVDIRGWLRWGRQVIMNAEIIKQCRDTHTRLPIGVTILTNISMLNGGYKVSDTDHTELERDNTISDESIAEYKEYEAQYVNNKRISSTYPHSIIPMLRWGIFHKGRLNMSVVFDEKGRRRIWDKYVFQGDKKEYIYTNDTYPDRLDNLILIDRIDTNGARYSELIGGADTTKEDWITSLETGHNENYFSSELSVNIFDVMKKEFAKIAFIEYETIRLQNEGKKVDLSLISSPQYFEKHGQTFMKSKWKTYKERPTINTNFHGSYIYKHDANIEAEMLALITNMSRVLDIQTAYLWELGNLRNRKYEDVSAEWDNIQESDISNNDRYSSFRIANIRGYFTIMHQSCEAMVNYRGLLELEKLRFPALLPVFGTPNALNISKNIPISLLKKMDNEYKYLSPIHDDKYTRVEKKEHILGGLYIFLKYANELIQHKEVSQLGKCIVNYILTTDRNTCRPSAITYTNIKSKDDDLETDVDIDINYEFNDRKTLEGQVDDYGLDFYDFSFEGGLEQLS